LALGEPASTFDPFFKVDWVGVYFPVVSLSLKHRLTA
jgi:hypothetical protein